MKRYILLLAILVSAHVQAEAPPRTNSTDAAPDESNALASPCTSWWKLSTRTAAQNLRVDHDCIEILSNTTLTIENGATLMIIASRGLIVGKNVRIVANGRSGEKGPKSRSTHTRAGFDNFNGNCRCVANADFPELRGGRGGPGGNGGTVQILARNATIAPDFALSVAGGTPGPEGDGGTVGCYDKGGSGRESASNVCPGGGPGSPGKIGVVDLWPSGAGSELALAAMSKAVTTQVGVRSGLRLDPVELFLRKRRELRDFVVSQQRGWDLLP